MDDPDGDGVYCTNLFWQKFQEYLGFDQWRRYAQ